MQDLRITNESEKVPRFFCVYDLTIGTQTKRQIRNKTDGPMGYNWQQLKMKKLFLVVIAAMTMVFGSSFKPNTTSQQIQSNAKPQQDQCYAVRVYFDIVWETRTERWGMSAVVSNQTMQSTSLVTDICAENESKAKDDAVYECYKYCNNREGKYIKETKDGHFIFEVRRVTEVEILGTCGGC